MQFYQYLPQIQKQLNKTRLNILILSLNQLTECVNINFNQHNCFILCKTQLEKNCAILKYKSHAITIEQLNNYIFDVAITARTDSLANVLILIKSIYFYCKKNSYFLKNFKKIDAYLYKKIDSIQINHNIISTTNNIVQIKIDNKLTEDIMLIDFPILIRSYNRLTNLYYTLNSLYSTILYNSEITIVDDSSTDEKLLKFYNTNQQIQLQKLSENILNNTKIKTYIGDIPQLPDKINGIKDKINVHRFQKNYGDCQGLMKTIKYGFQQYPNAPFIVIVEDDLLFNKNWLTQLLIIYQNYKENLGIASVYNTCKALTKLTDLYNTIQTTVGLTLLVTKQLYLYLKNNGYLDKSYLQHPVKSVLQREKQKLNIRQKLEDYNCSGDTHLSWYCNDANLNIITTAVQFVQHFDIHNSVCNSDLNKYLRLANKFVKPFEFNNLNIEKNHILIKNPQRILIFSNIKIDKEKISQLNITDNDLLVFLNRAYAIQYFKQFNNKIIFHRYSHRFGYFGLIDLKNISCIKFGIGGNSSNISKEQLQIIKQNYNQDFYKLPQVIKNNKKYGQLCDGPTTGWLVQFLMKLRYPNSKIQLISFFPTTDYSTGHWIGHDWKFQNEYYENHKEIKIYDLRIKQKQQQNIQIKTPEITENIIQQNEINMNIVYVLDNTKQYVDMCLLSAKSLLNIHPDANIIIVSNNVIPNIPYKNIVLQDLNNIQLKHNKNDRITSVSYLKLLLTKLPFKKCLFIDPDTLILKNLTQLYNTNVQYIGCTQSHNYGKKQAKQLNNEKYFLSGVMLLNLQNLRQINFYDKILTIYKDLSNPKYNVPWQHEETILNIQFYDLITQIDRKFNYCFNRQYNNPIKYEDTYILHFPGKDKSAMYTIAKFKNIV